MCSDRDGNLQLPETMRPSSCPVAARGCEQWARGDRAVAQHLLQHHWPAWRASVGPRVAKRTIMRARVRAMRSQRSSVGGTSFFAMPFAKGASMTLTGASVLCVDTRSAEVCVGTKHSLKSPASRSPAERGSATRHALLLERPSPCRQMDGHSGPRGGCAMPQRLFWQALRDPGGSAGRLCYAPAVVLAGTA